MPRALSSDARMVLMSLSERPEYNTSDLLNQSPMMLQDVGLPEIADALRELEAAGLLERFGKTYSLTAVGKAAA
jgi:predicted transcriptional regulator